MTTSRDNPWHDAFILLEWNVTDDDGRPRTTMMPIVGLTPLIMTRIINTNGDAWSRLAGSGVRIMPPIDLGALTDGERWRDYHENAERDKVSMLTSADLRMASIVGGIDGDLRTFGMPRPDDRVLADLTRR